MQTSFDYYTTAQTPIDCARWIAFIRLFAYVRTPACIYSRIAIPSGKKIWRDVNVIPVPDYISNILADFISEVDAREAALNIDKLPVSDASMLKDLYIESGVIPFRDYNSTFKPRGLEPYGLCVGAVYRLGASCVGMLTQYVGYTPRMEILLAEAVWQLSLLDIEPSALRPDEVSWLARCGYTWTRGVVYDEA